MGNCPTRKRAEPVQMSDQSKMECDAAVLKCYTKRISNCAKAAQMERALRMLRELRGLGLQPDVVCYTAAINTCAKARDPRQAMELLREMALEGLSPDVICYNAAISACAKGGESEQALGLMEEMRGAGVEPDVITYNSAISACANAGLGQNALDLLRDMRCLGLEPDVISYSAAIDACAKDASVADHCDQDRILALLAEMEEYGLQPNAICYNTAMRAFSQAKLPERAIDLMREMRTKGVVPTQVCYGLVIDALAGSGERSQCRRAAVLLQELHERGADRALALKCLHSVVAACVRDSDFDFALDFLVQMRQRGLLHDFSGFSGLLSACSPQALLARGLDRDPGLDRDLHAAGRELKELQLPSSRAPPACAGAGRPAQRSQWPCNSKGITLGRSSTKNDCAWPPRTCGAGYRSHAEYVDFNVALAARPVVGS